MSYRYAWGLIRKAEDKLGANLIDASKGGRLGGGSSSITELGEHFIKDFEKIQGAWRDFRDHYDSQLLVDADVIDVEGELALKIDDIVYLPADNDLVEGTRIKLRFSIA